MTADLALTVLQAARADRGYVASFAITDSLLVAVGGLSHHGPSVVASSNARQFEPRTTPRELGLRAVLAVGDTLWTCGEYGQLAVSRDHGASWSLLETATDGCLFGLAIAPDGAVWVVGDLGYAARVVGDTPTRVELGTRAQLSKVYAIGDELVVLGSDGTLRRWRQGATTEVATGSTRPLTALVITRAGTWVVVGDDGFIARSPDGRWFSRVTLPVHGDLEASTALPDGRLVVVGAGGQILVSRDDGRSWHGVGASRTTAVRGHHLWAVAPFGTGALIGGDGGLIAKLAPAGDATWSDRPNVFGGALPLDAAFAMGPAGFLERGLGTYLAAIAEAAREDHGADEDEEAAEDFRARYGVPIPAELARLEAITRGADRRGAFAELRFDPGLAADAGEPNLFERRVRHSQRAPLGTALVEAFCGVCAIGTQASGDSYHLEIYEWDGPRQVLHFDREEHAFSGVFADSLESLVYLAAIVRAGEARAISRDAYELGLRRLRGKVAPSWQFALDDKDPQFVVLEPRRHDSELFFYRARWICALLENDSATDLEDIASLFMAELNQVIPPEQLAARYEACAKFIPTALYAMWRAYLFDEPELEQYLGLGQRHVARLVRDAAALIIELRGGRNELGTITDVRAWLAAFRALDLDPRRATERAREAEARRAAEAARARQVADELARTPRCQWGALAWTWIGDGTAQGALWHLLATGEGAAPPPHGPGDVTAAQLTALSTLAALDGEDRAGALAPLAGALAPELEAILVGSLVRDDHDLAGSVAAEILVARATQGVLDPRVAPILRPLLEVPQKYEYRRRAVVDILGALRDRDSIPALVQIVEDLHRCAPRAASGKQELLIKTAGALGAFGDPAGLPALRRLAVVGSSHDDEVRQAARAACDAIATAPGDQRVN